MTVRRNLGDRHIKPIGLGCMGLSAGYGPALPKAQSIRLLNEALDLGYDFFDTASIYGLGSNENLISEAIGHRRDEYFIASKCVASFKGDKPFVDGSPDAIKSQCEGSLQRLGTDRIDLYYMHRLDFKVPIEESIGALADLKAAGKILAIGVSEISAETLRRAHATHPIAAIQSEYSLWTRNPELGVLDACKALGIAFVAFSPVARGFFTDAPPGPEDFSDKDIRRTMPRFERENLTRNLELRQLVLSIAADLNIDLSQLALAWVLAQGDNIFAIPGTTKSTHLRQNFATLDIELPSDVITSLSEAFSPDAVAGNRYGQQGQKAVDTETFEFESQEI